MPAGGHLLPAGGNLLHWSCEGMLASLHQDIRIQNLLCNMQCHSPDVTKDNKTTKSKSLKK